MALQQATAALEAAKARAALTALGPTTQQLAVAQSQVDAARVAVQSAASRGPGAEAAVQAAVADRASAQASLDQIRAGATAEDIAMAQAHVTAAEAALARARAGLAQSQVIAPFAGQVGSVVVRLGEMATPERFLVLLGDTNTMHVKTTDLRETDVVRLQVGMPVEVTFDALPERIFSGEITRIAPVSNTEKGSTNYTVEVDVDELDPGLRWGMTAFVNITAPR
jgi:multidrug resistance efflux pump